MSPPRRLARGLAGAVLALWPGVALAAEEGGLTTAALKMVGVLAVVLGLLLVLGYLVRRFLPSHGRLAGLSREMSILGQFPLGPKRFLALVKVGEEVFLLGITETNVNLLAKIEDPALLERLRQEPSGPSFGKILKKISGKREGEGA